MRNFKHDQLLIVTKGRVLVILKRLRSKQCGRCFMSSLIRVHTVCLYPKNSSNVSNWMQQATLADDTSICIVRLIYLQNSQIYIFILFWKKDKNRIYFSLIQ